MLARNAAQGEDGGNGARACAVILMPEIRFVLLAMLTELRRRVPNLTFHGYVSTVQEITFYRPHLESGLFQTLQNSEALFRNPPPAPPGDELWPEARAWETTLGMTFAKLAVSNRHFGRGYALAGSGHPRSRMSEEFDLARMTWSYVLASRFWDQEFAKHKFSLVLNGGNLVYLMARVRQAQFRMLLGSRFENLHFWAEDSFFSSPHIEASFKSLEENASGVDFERPYMVERTHRNLFNRRRSAPRLLIQLARLVARRVYQRLRGYEKAKGYYLADELRQAVREWFDTRHMTGAATVSLAEIKGRPFIFFPLHTEPESSVGQISPEFFFQHAAIAALSRDLPAGVVLAVKETIHGVGRRPPAFYRQIADLKNVVWLNMDEYGLDVVREATGVATITGTAGMEAAVLGKPVIAFGRHNIYNFLDHVFAPADITDLAGVLHRIVVGEVDLAKARRDGSRYLDAVKRTSFDMLEYDYVHLDKFSPTAVSAAVDSLLRGLDWDISAAASRGNSRTAL